MTSIAPRSIAIATATGKTLMPRDEKQFVLCRDCGEGYCGRVIDKRDGSVWPEKDTGYRRLNG